MSRRRNTSLPSARARKWSSWRSRAAAVSPASPNRSAANWRMVSSSRYRASLATTSDLSTSRPSASSTSPLATGPPEQTERAASRSNPPASTARRRRTIRSDSSRSAWLQSIDAASVCWRGAAPRWPRTSSANRSSRPASTCCGVSVRSHAAASSSASGMPSRRAHIVSTAASLDASSVNQGRTMLARSTNRASASSRGQRRHLPRDFARDPDGLARGGQHRHLGTGAEQRESHFGDAVEHPFAVVEADEGAPVAQLGGRRAERAAGRLYRRTDHVGQVVGHGGRVRERLQLDPPDAVGPRFGAGGGALRSQPRLAGAADAGKGHQPARP